ncbi:MAG: GNAT family N-acetyltransferase [Actinomycetota bacterium]
MNAEPASPGAGAGPVVIRGERVTLRAFRPEELDAWFDARMSTADDPTVSPVGPPDRERLRERVERSGVMHDQWLDLAIEVDGRLAGEIGSYQEPDREVQPGRYFLGIGLFAPPDRGRGIGTEATRLFCGWLFGEAGAERIETATAVTNAPMRGVLERLGFHFDGVETRWDVEWAAYSVDRRHWAPRSP